MPETKESSSPTDSLHLNARELNVESNDDDYDPHIHRVVQKPTNYLETLAHIIKCCLGTGILAMPQGFLQAGYLVGFIGTFLIGLLCTYCIHILVQCQYILCKRRRVGLLTYPESMRVAFEVGPECLRKHGNLAYNVTDIFVMTYQVGICSVYVLFCATNIKQLVDFYFIELHVVIHMLILLIPFYMLLNIRSLKVLAPFSTFANIITFIGLGMIISYVVVDAAPLSERNAFGKLSDFPLFFGTVLFAIVSMGVIIALENNMATPRQFTNKLGVLNVGMFVIVTMYAILGLLGYLKYGDKCEGSITLNLPQDETLSQSVKAMLALAVFISYGLQGFVPISILWENYIKKRVSDSSRHVFWQQALIIGLVLISFIFAAAVPRLGLFISLVGSFFLSALGVGFPALIEICTLWPNNFGRFNYIYYKDILLIIIGVFALVSGTYAACRDIIISFM